MQYWYLIAIIVGLIGMFVAFERYAKARYSNLPIIVKGREEKSKNKKKKKQPQIAYVTIDVGIQERIETAGYLIRKGAWIFIRTQYLILGSTAAIFGIGICFVVKPIVALVFFLGCVCSSVAGIFGMHTSSHTNHRTTSASLNGLTSAMRTAFPGGATMGLFAVSLALIGLCLIGYFDPHPETLFTAFSLGATLTALFARAGGGMFTKGADVAADLVGKIVIGLPEDSPKNPAVLADWIGDMVNDCAGMGADQIDSLVAFLFSAILLFTSISVELAFFPLLFMCVGLLSSIIGCYIISYFKFRNEEKANPGIAINVGTYLTYAIFLAITFLFAWLMPVATFKIRFSLWLATAGGVIAGSLIGICTSFFTDSAFSPVKKTYEACKTSSALGVSNSFVVGMKSTFLPMLGIAISALFSFYICERLGSGWGMLGIAQNGLGLIANTAIILSIDAFGPIADNAQGIGSYAGFSSEELRAANKIDELGNTTAAWGKGIINLLTAITLINLIMTIISSGIAKFGLHGLLGITQVDIGSIGALAVRGISSMLIGGAMPWIFAAMVMEPVKEIAMKICQNIFKQTKENPGILEGTVDPDYDQPIKLATKGALSRLLPPVLLLIVITVAIRFIPWFSYFGLIGYVVGGVIGGLCLALFMANAGGNADNAKKTSEAEPTGSEHGKGSQTHKNTVVGDTVGDPLKDTGAPSINGVLTLMGLLALFLFII